MPTNLLTRQSILALCALVLGATAVPDLAWAGVATEVIWLAAGTTSEVGAEASAQTEPGLVGSTEDSPPEPDKDVVVDGEFQPDSMLTLAEAIDRALAAHPGLASLKKEYWALDAEAWQEGRKPNPELELEFEEFGGTADARGFRALATSLTFTQPIERGGKRTRRETAAALAREIVLWDVAELRHEILAETRTAFAAAQAEQYSLEMLGKYRELVQQIYTTVEIQVDAGRSARLELERLEVELARFDLEIETARRSVAQAQLELAGNWGATSVDFAGIDLADTARAQVPALEHLLPLLSEHPAVARFDAEYEALCALVDLENGNAVPDLAVFGGVTRINESEETVFKIGLALDLPINDKNEGSISAAGYRLEQVEDNRADALRSLEIRLAGLQQRAAHAAENHDAYGASLIPAALETLALTQEGYNYGKFQLLDVLDAQRTVLELESDQAAALLELRRAVSEIEALLDRDLDQLVQEAAPAELILRGNEEHNHD